MKFTQLLDWQERQGGSGQLDDGVCDYSQL
jgi:hypothetical protein